MATMNLPRSRMAAAACSDTYSPNEWHSSTTVTKDRSSAGSYAPGAGWRIDIDARVRSGISMLTSAVLITAFFTAAAQPIILPLVPLENHYALNLTVGVDGSGTPAVTVKNVLIDSGSVDCVLLDDALTEQLAQNKSMDNQHIKVGIIADGALYQFVEGAPAEFALSLRNDTPVSAPVTVALSLQANALNSRLELGWIIANGMLGLLHVTDGSWPLRASIASSLLFQRLLQGRSGVSPHVFALNFTTSWRDRNTTASLAVGAPHSTVVGAGLVWSERSPLPLSNGYTFTAYSVSACGVAAVTNISSHVTAVVNTSSACLSLPAEVFDNVVNWLPLTCQPVSAAASVLPSCVLDVDNTTAVDALPLLSFQLSPGGPPLTIDLLDLVLFDGSLDNVNSKHVCLLRGRSLAYLSATMAPLRAALVVGTMPLRSLYAVVDADTPRVGFSNKRIVANVTELASRCKPRVQCIGSQVLYLPGNVCVPPRCSEYYFQYLDVPSQTCTYVSAVRLYPPVGCFTPVLCKRSDPWLQDVCAVPARIHHSTRDHCVHMSQACGCGGADSAGSARCNARTVAPNTSERSQRIATKTAQNAKGIVIF